MKNQKGSIVIILLVIVVLVISGGVYVSSLKNSGLVSSSNTTQTVQITTSQSNTIESVSPVQNTSIKTNSTGETTITYTNTKFGFKFSYPTSWKITGEIGKSDSSYRPPYLFDEIITTENHPINRAGHVSVLSLSLEKFMEETQKSATIKVEGLTDFNTINLQGKKFRLVRQQVQGSTSQQTDYVYALSLGDKTLFINFISMDTPEKQISKELELKIDQFVKTISVI
jgi:hypothetical protein